jgi:RimJ/RimL family protein N-acetyltransferase
VQYEGKEDPADIKQHHDKMLRLVARSFYHELINYGVNEAQVLSVAGHLLDNVMQKGPHGGKNGNFYNQLFTTRDIVDEWLTTRRLSVHQVSIVPLDLACVPQVAQWLEAPEIRHSFYPTYPSSVEELTRYFQAPTRQYFAMLYQNQFAGIIGAEHIDPQSAKLEMRKMVGDPRMHGKGIGKRATFLFLYHSFLIRKFTKVYLHSLDINIRNLNLNAHFGFELEGVFLEDALVQDKRRDVVRMGLFAPVWLKLFQHPVPPKAPVQRV